MVQLLSEVIFNQASAVSGSVINRDAESYTNELLQFAHFTLFLAPPLGTDSIVPKKERFSLPQFGHGPFKIKKSFTMALVIACATQNIRGSAANHVKMKLKGSGNSRRYVISKPVKSSRKKNL